MYSFGFWGFGLFLGLRVDGVFGGSELGDEVFFRVLGWGLGFRV